MKLTLPPASFLITTLLSLKKKKKENSSNIKAKTFWTKGGGERVQDKERGEGREKKGRDYLLALECLVLLLYAPRCDLDDLPSSHYRQSGARSKVTARTDFAKELLLHHLRYRRRFATSTTILLIPFNDKVEGLVHLLTACRAVGRSM